MAKQNGSLAVKLQPIVSAEAIAAIKAGRERLATLARETKGIEDSIGPLETEIIAAIEAGAKVEAGGPRVLIAIEQQREPKWEEALVKAAGKEAADAVIARTLPSVTKRLVIS